MIALLARRADPHAVVATLTAVAEEEGLEPVDLAAEATDPFAMIAILAGPRAVVSAQGEVVLVTTLESLDVADADEWATHLANVAEEVLALEAADDSVRVYVAKGQALETVEVPLAPRSGRVRAEGLAPFAPTEAFRRELTNGVVAPDLGALVTELLRCLGAKPASPASTTMLAFRDPLDEMDDEEMDDAEEPDPGAP